MFNWGPTKVSLNMWTGTVQGIRILDTEFPGLSEKEILSKTFKWKNCCEVQIVKYFVCTL